MELVLGYVFLGAVAGILAGTLGIGGGIVLVPMFLFLFQREGLPAEHLVHFAIGTSMACVLFTSASSALSHNRRRNVDWRTVRSLWSFVALGALLGAALSPLIDGHWLGLGVATFQCWMATRILIDRGPTAGERPWVAPRSLAGTVIGSVSSVIGVAGATLMVPYFVGAGIDVRKAIGSSAALSIPLALAGVAGYLTARGAPVGGSHTLGFLYLPALAGVVPASFLTTALGTRIATALPVAALKRMFALVLYLVSARMVWNVFVA